MGIPVCMNMCVSASIRVSCTFAVAPFLLFVLSYSVCLYLFLILLLFLDKRFITRGSKGVDSDGRGGGKDLREIGEGENVIKIYCKKIL